MELVYDDGYVDLVREQLLGVVRAGRVRISEQRPSEWTEQHMKMGKPRPGPFRYESTPYAKEIIDLLARDSGVREFAVMKGAQIGFSSGVIYPGIGWMIENNPGNTYLMVGAADLVEKAMGKIDAMLNSSKLRQRGFIKPQNMRLRNSRTGDKNNIKEFIGGMMIVGSANNPRAIAQMDLETIYLDDLDQMRGETDVAGDLIPLIRQRAAAYRSTYRLGMISTPLRKETSNIYPIYKNGDRRKWMVPCRCCGQRVEFRWRVQKDELMNELTGVVALYDGGIEYSLNELGQVDRKSVGFVCYLCGEWQDDRRKDEQVRAGKWEPTAVSKRPDFRSYHINSLYAPSWMMGWYEYALSHAAAYPVGEEPDERKVQTFMNMVEGWPYEKESASVDAGLVSGNRRGYVPGMVPELVSIADGNGRIVMLTCAVDMNGKEDDARIDYEIVAWPEHDVSYSVLHGSIGTFVYNEKNREGGVDMERVRWTYRFGEPNSVWPELERIITSVYWTEDGGTWLKPQLTGIDCGHLDKYAHQFLDSTNAACVGLRGSGDEDYQRLLRRGDNVSLYTMGKVRKDVYYLKVGILKDEHAENMAMKWTEGVAGAGGKQPPGFMNFPESRDGLYERDNFFSHYEAEKRVEVVKKDGQKMYRWVKRSNMHENHLLDCRIYNMALRRILVDDLAREHKDIRPFGWPEAAAIIMGNM